MANQTPRFGFTTFDVPTDQLDYRQYKFSAADRELVDRVLTYAVENHTHTGSGEQPVTETAPAAPVVNVSPTGGRLPANAAIYYRYGLVDSAGQEHLASQPSSTQTGPVVISPAMPTLDINPIGNLVAGTYSYTVSAYTQETTCETMTSGAVSTYLPTGGAVTIDLPSLPSGATGYNVYRKGPMDTIFSFLVAHAENPLIAAYVDDGSTAPNALRSVPTANTTATTSSATITPPIYPYDAGAVSWRVYRTYDPANWDNSLIEWEDSGSVTDTGHATVVGSPLTANAATSSPTKIDLGDETTGTLPATATPTTEVVTFSFRGPVEAGDGRWQWINDFDQVRLISFRANLGKGRVPTERPVQVALERLPTGATDWTRYTYTWGSDFLAEVRPANTFGSQVPFPYGTEGTRLFPGDALRPVVVQDGGPSNTDADLVVSVTCAVRHGTGPQDTTAFAASGGF